jgi:hypothetical protein
VGADEEVWAVLVEPGEEVLFDERVCLVAVWDEAFFSALPCNDHPSVVPVLSFDADELADAKSGRVEDLEHCPIPESEAASAVWSGQQHLDFFLGDDAGQRAADLGSLDQERRVFLDDAFFCEELEELAHGHSVSCDASEREPLAFHPDHPQRQLTRRHLSGRRHPVLALEVSTECDEVSRVGIQGVLREPLLDATERDEPVHSYLKWGHHRSTFPLVMKPNRQYSIM